MPQWYRPFDVSSLKPMEALKHGILQCFTPAAPNLVQVLSRCCSVVWWSQRAYSSNIQRGYRIHNEKKTKKQNSNRHTLKSFIDIVFHQHLLQQSSIDYVVFILTQHDNDNRLCNCGDASFIIWARHVFYVQKESRFSFFTMSIAFHIVNM